MTTLAAGVVVTVALSATLLFVVQPLMGRLLLPVFGGGAQVWLVCLAFFQVALLIGYAYAYALVRWLKPAHQAAAHITLLVASLAALPPAVGSALAIVGLERPAAQLLSVLAVGVGSPFVALSATTTLLQTWYVTRTGSAYPYWLFGLSNAGSMAGLLAYPTLLEPFLPLQSQARLWSAGYVFFAVSCGAIAFLVWSATPSSPKEAGGDRVPEAPMRWPTAALWGVVPACTSALLLATTQELTHNVAPVPLLWVPVLGAYLASFIVTFSFRSLLARTPWRAAALASLVTIALLGQHPPESLLLHIVATISGFFFICVACHAELLAARPEPGRLADYYLAIAAGGALGAVAVSLVAPVVFDWYYELPATLALVALLLGWLPWRGDTAAPPVSALHLGLGALAVGVTLAWAAVSVQVGRSGDVRVTRNFYGVLRVADFPGSDGAPAQRRLLHGAIVHGVQLRSPADRHRPTTYYAPATGIGRLLSGGAGMLPRRVGLVGMGTGTLAAYGRAGDLFRIYEINPAVVELARRDFSFLADSAATIEVALGDARLVMDGEPSQQYDVLVIDAFSSDAIPVHLLTIEAFASYLRHLKPAGTLAFHVSNRYLNLAPVVASAARALQRHAVVIESPADDAVAQYRAVWVLVGSEAVLRGMSRGSDARVPAERARHWTDDYSNLLAVLK